ncbi:MAG: GFA family protein [Rhodobacter sp.]|nr:GFA family protein [Rhodobacter sp.]
MNGQCMCGAVTVTAEPARDGLTVCHCDMCRRWGSVAFMAMTPVEGSVQVDGPVKIFQSSDWAERAFCETCGSGLWYRITAPGPGQGQYHLAAGLFDLNGMRVSLELFSDCKPDAYAFAGTRKQMTRAEVMASFATDGGD